MTPIGILGGTFDPIHLGHLRIAEEVADALALPQVRIIPSGTPPHRAAPRASAVHRLAMCELAVQNNPRFAVDACEVHKTTASYTVETLEHFERDAAQRGGIEPLVLILGADAFLGLHQWHRWTEVLMRAHIALVARPGFDIAAQLPSALRELYAAQVTNDVQCVHTERAGAIVPVSVTALDISATKIRALAQAGKSVRYLVPEAVEDYLHAHQLYATPAS
jgi:nicotinate-nucleotide adenylyltransferase